ncbi:MAG: sigma 54-interacting transcriptional regulator [Myxococcota bacterium]|jgi:transcriptional regulator with GAF, ATPase, and Fis domain|nr:sigma 54-interacting transcriptional regulator [Myxococcota bacterium]
MLTLEAKAKAFARWDRPVLLLGERGTGKTTMARQIHTWSKRARARFVPVDCAAIPNELFEAEMFGYVKGAFTGANQSKEGRFQLADKGTLFLDELAELEPAKQAALLVAAQEGVVWRVGASIPETVNVRIIAATNRPLHALRADLRDRLSTFWLRLPTLSERGDAAKLAVHYCAKLSEELGEDVRLSSTALAWLSAQRWPGNIRQLQNALTYAAALGYGRISKADLEEALQEEEPPVPQPFEPAATVLAPELVRHNIVAQLSAASSSGWFRPGDFRKATGLKQTATFEWLSTNCEHNGQRGVGSRYRLRREGLGHGTRQPEKMGGGTGLVPCRTRAQAYA